MDSPSAGPESDSTAPPPARQRPVKLLAIGCLVLAVVLVGRHLLIQGAHDIQFDPTPAPRPRINAPFIKSADVVVDQMIEIAQITPEDTVYDLGCGDGRIIVTAALQRGCQGIGFDIDPERVAEARENVMLHDVERLVSIQQQDIFTVDLSQADVVVMYLLPWMVQKLTPQLEKMKPGSRIVSHDFYIEGVEPERVVRVQVDPESDSRHGVYLYTIPLHWNPDMPKKPPTEGIADRADAVQAASQAPPDTDPADSPAATPAMNDE